MRRFVHKKLNTLCKDFGRDIEILYEFDFDIPNTKFDGEDMKAWKGKKYKNKKGKGRKPKGYHKKDTVSIELCLFHLFLAD